MSFLDGTGLARFWSNIKSKFVAKETGKGLSTNDFTTAKSNQIETNKTDISNIKNGTNIDSFSDVETALGNKQDKITLGDGLHFGTGADANKLDLDDEIKFERWETIIGLYDSSTDMPMFLFKYFTSTDPNLTYGDISKSEVETIIEGTNYNGAFLYDSTNDLFFYRVEGEIQNFYVFDAANTQEFVEAYSDVVGIIFDYVDVKGNGTSFYLCTKTDLSGGNTIIETQNIGNDNTANYHFKVMCYHRIG